VCVICVKPVGVEMPSEDRMSDMFHANSDGAGFMFVRNDKVVIRKGFMKMKHLRKGLTQEEVTKDDLVVLHFRIATAGSVRPANTHPFPLSSNERELRALRLETNVAMAHNGILQYEEDKKADLSDTMTFVRDILSDPAIKDSIFEKAVYDLLDMSIGSSKMVFIDKDRNYLLLGAWSQDTTSKDGMFYSNLNFIRTFTFRRSYGAADVDYSRPGAMDWEKKYKEYYGRWPSDLAWERDMEKRELEEENSVMAAVKATNEKKEDFADGQCDNLVVIDYDAKKCVCGYPIASYQQMACSKCGKIFYREHDSAIYAH
jgi:predicted glutamine amidotransferase